MSPRNVSEASFENFQFMGSFVPPKKNLKGEQGQTNTTQTSLQPSGRTAEI